MLARYLEIVLSQQVPSGAYSVATEGYLLPPRSFHTLEAAAKEIGVSRYVSILVGVTTFNKLVESCEVECEERQEQR